MAGDIVIIASGPNLTETELERLAVAVERAQLRHWRDYPEVRFKCHQVQPPAYDYITADTYLQINVYPTTAENPVTISAKLLLPEGRITTQQWTVIPQVGPNINQFIEPMQEGFLLSLTATIASESTVLRGDTYVQVGLQYSADPSTPLFRVILQGYVTTTCALGYPDGSLEESVSGKGMIQTVVSGTPLPGNDFEYNFPTALRGRIISALATLNTSATVGDRQVNLAIFTSSLPAFGGGSSTTIPASTTANFSFCAIPLGNAPLVNGFIISPIPPDIPLLPGGKVYSVTTNLDSGDQWSPVIVTLETWVEA